MRMLLIGLVAAAAFPQDDPLSGFDKSAYATVQGILLRSAEKMPEESYSFKPTDTVRAFGQIVGHVADSQYLFCSIVLGEKNPAPKIEQTKTSKADLMAALKEAFTYCDKAYEGMTDASGAQMVKLFGKGHAEAERAPRQQHAQPGTLRQHGHVPAHEEPGSAYQRTGLPVAAEEEVAGPRPLK